MPMFSSLEIHGDRDREPFCRVPGFELDPASLARHEPDALWLLRDVAPDDSGGRELPAARCALWWQGTPPYESYRLGLVGHYYARNQAAGVEVLRLACHELATHGCTLAVGPMDGSTWRRYRLITERGAEPPFFLEPDNPDDWPGHFTSAGFAPLTHYYSALAVDPEPDPRAAELAARLEGEGISLRELRPGRFEDELRAIYALSRQCFRDNFLYTPIPEEHFLDLYRGIRPHVIPDLVFLAESGDTQVGFLFAIPDVLRKNDRSGLDTVVVKTMAVHPEQRGGGLGGLLMARCVAAARRLGFRRVIHALMHEGNASRKISDHSARAFRRYTLFARPLEARP
jgi:GNAT superfamily N-acetyltransferase